MADMTAEEIGTVLDTAPVCRLGLNGPDGPYVVPVNFAADGNALYFHSGKKGTKLGLIKADPRVAFQTDTDTELVPAEQACRFSVRYRSVIGRGRARLVEDEAEKRRGLDLLMAKYGGRSGGWEYATADLERIVVVRIDIEMISGKQKGY